MTHTARLFSAGEAHQAVEGIAPVVSVFGSGDPGEEQGEYRIALAVGRELARLGYSIANGGYGGTMEASARAAREAGAEVIGVTCAIWDIRLNAYSSREVRTAHYAQRLDTLIEIGRAGYVCLPGSTGTLVELAKVWEMTAKGVMPRRSLVCVGRFWRPLIEMMDSARPGSSDYVALIERAEQLGEHFPEIKGQIP